MTGTYLKTVNTHMKPLGFYSSTLCVKSRCGQERFKDFRYCEKHYLISLKSKYAYKPKLRKIIRRTDDTNLYAIKAGNAVKFGVAMDVGKRRSDLQVSQPEKLEILASIPCPKSLERQVHLFLKETHIRGEWFKLDWRAKAVINFMNSGNLPRLAGYVADIKCAEISNSSIFRRFS